MLATKVSPILMQKTIRPIGTNIIRRLRVPILAASMVLGGAIAAKAQTNVPQKDRFEQTTTIVTDTLKDKAEPTLNIVNDSILDGNVPDTLVKAKGKINDNTSLGIQVVVENPLSLDASETAAEELYTKVMANISNSGDNPYSALFLALQEQRGNGGTAGQSALGTIDDQIDELTESMKEYNRSHRDENKELMLNNGSITNFHYGKDNSKTGTLIQMLDISGINKKDQDNTTQNDSVSNNNNNNNFMGNVAYRMKAVTDKAEVETNIHAGSEDIDIQLAAAYKTKTTDGGNLALTLNGRETMVNNITNGSLGASADYNKNKFSTGLYYYYNRNVDETGTQDKYSELEGYLKYAQNVNLKAGLQFTDFYKYYYSNLKLSGTKDFENNLKVSGALSAEFGHFNINFNDPSTDNLHFNNFDFGANCGAYFKTDDISASLNGRASYRYLVDLEDHTTTGGLNLSLLGAFATDKISISAMISAYKESMFGADGAAQDNSTNNVNLATGVGFEIKDLLNGISPLFTYSSTSIDNDVKHFFNVTVKTSIEALRKKQ